MMRSIGAIVLVSLLAGCCTERKPYSVRVVWQHWHLDSGEAARLGDAAQVFPAAYSHVVEITDGMSGGTCTTAHGSHKTVELCLREQPVAGKAYQFDASEGDLRYNGFAGLWSQELDPMRPAKAQLRVTEAGRNRIQAEYEIELWYRRKEDTQNRSHLFRSSGAEWFRLKQR